MAFRFHCLGIPHTVTSKEYLPCAFTQKVLKFSQMMVNLGHEVIHYGNEASELVCSEHVTVTTLADLDKTYGDRNYWKTTQFQHSTQDHVFREFTRNAKREVVSRIRPNDFLLCFWGLGHQEIAQSVDENKVFVVEPGIGYPHVFAPYLIFESYSKMHLQRGILHQNKQELYTQVNWNYEVIPNYFDPEDFEYSEEKDDYLFFIGRLMNNKGIEIAMRLADYFDIPLKLASQTDPKQFKNIMGWDPYDCIEFVGMVDIEQRKKLMSRAKAGVCASLYMEPFCGTHIEFGFSGTPVLTTDFGVFSETVLQGENGWRCMSFEEFVYAFENIDTVKPERCRELAMQYSLDRVSLMYHEYFDRIYRSKKQPHFWDIASDRIPCMNMKKEILSESEIEKQILEIRQQNGVVENDVKEEVEIKEVVNNSNLKQVKNKDNIILHVLAPPHGWTSKTYFMCPLTQKALKFCKMMSDYGLHVIHYGNEDSELVCSEYVTVTTLADLDKTYGDRNYWKKEDIYLPRDSSLYKIYHKRIVPALLKQIISRPKDHHFILFFQMDCQHDLIKKLEDQLEDSIKKYIVEASLPNEFSVAPYRVFQSYAHEHYMRGLEATIVQYQISNKQESAKNRLFFKDTYCGKYINMYDDTLFRSTVIPNYFDPEDFEYSAEKDDYLFYIGRMMKNKGIEIAMRLADYVGLPLKVAGNGNRDNFIERHGFEPYDCVEFVGFADVETRKRLMSRAKVGICASMFIEPCCNVAVEFGFSGTPVLATDCGGYTETIINGVNGWRCRSFEDFVIGYENLDKIKSQDCRNMAMRFTLETTAHLYEVFFERIIDYEKYNHFWEKYSH